MILLGNRYVIIVHTSMRRIASKQKSRTIVLLESEIDRIVVEELVASGCLRKVSTHAGERVVITKKGRGVLKFLEQQLKVKERCAAS
jgi:hypothetical protein